MRSASILIAIKTLRLAQKCTGAVGPPIGFNQADAGGAVLARFDRDQSGRNREELFLW